MSREPLVIDVSLLPRVAFGHKNLIWWGTMGLIAIESTMFVLLFVSFAFLRSRVTDWPPGLIAPDLLWGTVNSIIFILSAVPNQLTKKAAERFDLKRVRVWLLLTVACAVLANGVRVLEFQHLNTSWDTNAYGSIVWWLLGFHTFHLLVDTADTLVITVTAFTGPLEEKRFVDFSDNALYWYFVMLSWVPVYALVYIAPRIL